MGPGLRLSPKMIRAMAKSWLRVRLRLSAASGATSHMRVAATPVCTMNLHTNIAVAFCCPALG